MYIVFFFVPYIVALAIFRNYFEFNCLRKIHSKSYIRKHNTGNLPMRIVFWNFRDELNKWLYSIFIACFFMPLTMPLLWLAAGENGLEVYYCFCLCYRRDEFRFSFAAARTKDCDCYLPDASIFHGEQNDRPGGVESGG